MVRPARPAPLLLMRGLPASMAPAAAGDDLRLMCAPFIFYVQQCSACFLHESPEARDGSLPGMRARGRNAPGAPPRAHPFRESPAALSSKRSSTAPVLASEQLKANLA